MLTLRHVHCLDAVVRAGSFRAAGELLHLSQPSVSMQIRSLEQELGLQLLRRSTRGATLTEAGGHLLPHLRALLRAEEAVSQRAAALTGGRGGRVRIGGVNSAVVGLLPEAIMAATRDHADLDVEVTELTSAEVREGVADGTFEIGLPADTVAAVDRPDIVSEVLAEGALVLVARVGHPLLREPAITRAMVAAEPLVTLRSGYSLRALALEYLAGHTPHISSEALNHGSVCRLVAGGLGVTIMPEMTFAASSERIAGLAAAPLADSDVVARLHMLHPGPDAPPATLAITESIRRTARVRFAELRPFSETPITTSRVPRFR